MMHVCSNEKANEAERHQTHFFRPTNARVSLGSVRRALSVSTRGGFLCRRRQRVRCRIQPSFAGKSSSRRSRARTTTTTTTNQRCCIFGCDCISRKSLAAKQRRLKRREAAISAWYLISAAQHVAFSYLSMRLSLFGQLLWVAGIAVAFATALAAFIELRLEANAAVEAATNRSTK